VVVNLTAISRRRRYAADPQVLRRPAPVDELTRQLFSEHAGGPIALRETHAHLENLRHAGLARSVWLHDLLHYTLID
jgi:hypothetical protein